MKLLEELCALRSPSGDERSISAFIRSYVEKNSITWKKIPTVHAEGEFQENIILAFGDRPTTAIFAHLDSVGFTVRYGKQLVLIGGPDATNETRLVGSDSLGEIECGFDMEKSAYVLDRNIDRGTNLTFKPDFRETDEYVQCCYMDNRLGVWNALQVAESLENGIIVFSTREEHGGGSVGSLGRFIYEKYGVRQALISDITWVTEGVTPGKGVAISMRDRGLPRRSYLEKVIGIAQKSGVPFQLEVEGSGGSDGLELQSSPYPWDWTFVGAAEDHVHSPNEIVHRSDIRSMTSLYKVLMEEL